MVSRSASIAAERVQLESAGMVLESTKISSPFVLSGTIRKAAPA